jgi:hypothetical protein
MSCLQSVRLAQLWQLRFRPLIKFYKKHRVASERDIFESVGWLIEGVFCGFFDSHEADVVWVRIAPLLEACGSPFTPFINESLAAEIIRLQKSGEPFRQTLQMLDGPQKQFELPLFPHALLLANRFASDRLAGICRFVVNSDDAWQELRPSWHSVQPSVVAKVLEKPDQAVTNVASLAAGYVRILEHMESSGSFFEYARSHSPRQSDFDSYCQRIGSLNAWRVPLSDPKFNRKFAQLPELLEFTIRPSIERDLPQADWSEFERSFSGHLSSLIQAWESHHLSASLATA